jgi:hypothetical protein
MELAEAPTDGARALESGGHDDVDTTPDGPGGLKTVLMVPCTVSVISR